MLSDAIDDCPEFLIHIPTLIKICRENGLDLVLMTPFHQFFDQYCVQGLDLLNLMKVFTSEGTFPEQDWEAAGIRV